MFLRLAEKKLFGEVVLKSIKGWYNKLEAVQFDSNYRMELARNRRIAQDTTPAEKWLTPLPNTPLLEGHLLTETHVDHAGYIYRNLQSSFSG
jgi:hypothetical protein